MKFVKAVLQLATRKDSSEQAGKYLPIRIMDDFWGADTLGNP